MKFSIEKLTEHISQIKQTIIRHQIRKIKQLNATDFVIYFARKKDIPLLFSYNNDSPFITLWHNQKEFDSLRSIVIDKLTKILLKTYVNDIEVLPDNRVVKMTISRYTDAYQEVLFYVYFELIPKRANVILTDTDNKILVTCRHSSLKQQAGIVKGNTYQIPIPPKVQIPSDDSLEVTDFLEKYWLKAYSLHLKNKYEHIYKLIKQKLQKLTKREKKLQADYKRHLDHLNDKQKADLLITYQEEIDIKNTVILEGINIDIDRSLSLFNNAAKYYHQYRKARRGITHVTREIDLIKQQLRFFIDLNDTISNYDEKGLLALQKQLIELEHLKSISNNQIKSNNNKKIPITNKLNPYFIIERGIKFSFGKNSKQNDFLTFTLAKKDDWFFHVKNHPGAHVVIHHPNPTVVQIHMAGEIALFVSKLNAGEIAYAQVKTLKKGKQSGQVIMKKHSSIRINELSLIDEEKIKKANR
jgi:predicted ribosome quality control (RQC) complex YloA/Tae2 family protein